MISPDASVLLAAEIATAVDWADTRIVRIAVDGVSGAGKTTFANALAEALLARRRCVIRASADDFHFPAAQRYRMGRDSPAGHYLESYDYDALKRELLDPFDPGGSRRYRTKTFDLESDTAAPSVQRVAPLDAMVMVDGLFLNRDELRRYWNVSIFLDVPFDIAIARCAQRDGTNADYRHLSNRRYVAGETRYLVECRPRDRASIVIDNADYSRPVRLR